MEKGKHDATIVASLLTAFSLLVLVIFFIILYR